jgi:hypothetical protein
MELSFAAAVVSSDSVFSALVSSVLSSFVSVSAETVVCEAVSFPAPAEHPNSAAAIQIDRPIDNTFFMLRSSSFCVVVGGCTAGRVTV